VGCAAVSRPTLLGSFDQASEPSPVVERIVPSGRSGRRVMTGRAGRERTGAGRGESKARRGGASREAAFPEGPGEPAKRGDLPIEERNAPRSRHGARDDAPEDA